MSCPRRFITSVAACFMAVGASPQEDSRTRETIAAEVEARFAALGPLFARATVESIELGGARKLRHEVEIHYRPGEFWMHSSVNGGEPGSREVLRLYEKDESHFVWEAGKDAERVDNAAFYKWYWKSQFELDGELAKILGLPAEAKSVGELASRVKPELILDLRGERLDNARSRVYVSMDRSPAGIPSWCQNLRWASLSDVVVTADEVIARFPSAGHETVIDRKTGFLKSVGNNFVTGDKWVLTVREVRTGEKKPEVKKPTRFRTRKPGGDDLAGGFGQFLYGYFHECLDKILANWGVAGSAEKAEPLRAFFTRMAARREALTSDEWHRNWTEAWLKAQRQGGRTLEDIIKNFEKVAVEVKEYLEQGDSDNVEEMRERTETFKKSLVRKAFDAPALEDAKKQLAKRLDEAFDRDRVDKARSKLPPTDHRGLLREAIEEARAKK